jgi:hypothetical protein
MEADLQTAEPADQLFKVFERELGQIAARERQEVLEQFVGRFR